MNKLSALSVLSLVLVVSVSGCIQVGEEEETKFGNGLIIDSFEAFPSSLFSGESYSVSAEVVNKGGRDANNILFYLFNVNQDTDIKTTSKLEPPTENVPGEVASKVWDSVNAPSVEEGITEEVEPRVRVYYKYSTLATTSMPVLSRTEWKRMLREDENMPSPKSTTVTHGPLSVDINARSPITVQSDETESFRISVTGNNIGSGTPYLRDSHPEGSGDIPISTENVNRISLQIDSGSDVVKGSGCLDGSQEVRVRKGNTFRYDCEITVKEGAVQTSADVPLTVKLRYGYLVDDSASVDVRGE